MEAIRDAVVVGAGPAGLFAAALLGAAPLGAKGGRNEGGFRSLVLEKKARPARKLLLSGSGQCNLTHAGNAGDFLGRYGGGAGPDGAARPAAAGRFLKPSLYAFDNRRLLDWFHARGLDFEIDDNGKYFPADRRASSVLSVLLRACAEAGAEIRTAEAVLSIERDVRGFRVATAAGPTFSRAVLIATGGASYPATGSEGDGFAFARELGHRVVTPAPALAAVRAKKPFRLAPASGLGFPQARLVLRRGGRKIGEWRGDLLVTHQGLSGPAVLDRSRDMAAGDLLEVDFVGAGDDSFRAAFAAALAAGPRKLARTCLAEAGLPRTLADLLCAEAGTPPERTASELRREEREAVLRLAVSYPVAVAALSGWDEAMATAGGVALDEVDPATMESRLVPGLFFAGEVLDLVGDTGGFNLQAAFSTGAAAARGMAAYLEGGSGAS